MAANGQLTALRAVSESSFGVQSGTTYKALRTTGNTLNVQKAVFQSNEIRSDRQLADLRHGLRNAAGDISVELGLTTYDDLIEAALSSTAVAVTTGAQSLGATAGAAGTATVTRAAGSFITDGFLVGDEVQLSGFTVGANNLKTRVTVVTALVLTVEATLSVDAAAAARTVALIGKRIKGGNVLKTLSIERAFTDINQFYKFSGMAVDQMKVSIKPEEIVTAVFTLIGKDGVMSGATAAVGGVTAAAINSPFDAFTGKLLEGANILATVTAVELTVTNGRAVRGTIGTQTPTDIFDGQQLVTGKMTAYFMDATLLAKFLAETESSLEVRLNDPNGVDFHKFRLPRIKYTGGELDNPKEGPVMLELPFTALMDATSGTAVVYQRSN